MKKLFPLFLVALLLTTAACSGNGATTSQPPTASPSSEPSAEEQTYTGILEEDKGFMITVAPEDKNDDSESYVFGTDGVTIDAKVGDKVTVTFTGDINETGSVLNATKVETVK